MADTVSERVRARIRDEMMRKHLSQRDLGGILEMNQSRISKLLNGRVQLGLEDLAALCFGVGISLTEAVRDHGLEFCAEMTPTELRLLEQFRRAPSEKREAVLTLFEVRTKTATPDRHAGILPTKKLGQRGA